MLALETISGTALTNVRELQAMHAIPMGAEAEEGVAVAAGDMVTLARLARGKAAAEVVKVVE